MKKNQALVVVDVQNDFLEKGALPVPAASEVVPVINKIAPLFDTVVFTQDWHPQNHISFASQHEGGRVYELVDVSYGKQVLWPDHCVQETAGAEFAPGLDTSRCALNIKKGTNPELDSYSAFIEADRSTLTGLAEQLKERGIDEVFVCGLATDFCVYWSALDALKLGFKTNLVEDACRGINIDGSIQKAIEDMKARGIHILTSAELS